MSRFAMTREEVSTFIIEMRSLSLVQPEREEILMGIVETASPRSKDNTATEHLLDEMVTKDKPPSDPVHITMSFLRGNGQPPGGPTEVMELLQVLDNPFHVNTLTYLLLKEIEEDKIVTELPLAIFYVVSAVLGYCLTYCASCLDYNSAERIMQISLALHAARPGASPAKAGWEVGSTKEESGAKQPPELLIPKELRNLQSPRSSKHSGEVAMSQRTQCHPFWAQRRFWTSRFQRQVASKKKELLETKAYKEQSQEDREHEEGAVAFNVLNKMVQLMLSFGLPEQAITEFVDQTIAMKMFKPDYMPMVEDMMTFVKSPR